MKILAMKNEWRELYETCCKYTLPKLTRIPPAPGLTLSGTAFSLPSSVFVL
jgi:hypothetical protein